MGLKEIVDILNEKEAESKLIPEETDPRVRAGVEAIVRNAKAAIPDIENQYKNEIIKHTVIVGVSGPKSKEFAQLALDGVKVGGVNFREVENRLLSEIRATSSSDRYGQNEHFTALASFNRLKLELNAVRLPSPQIGRADGIYEALLEEAIPAMIQKNYENSLYSVVSRKLIGDLALKDKWVGNFFPVVLYNYTAPVDKNFLPEPVLEIVADKEYTVNEVKKIMNKMRSKLLGLNKETKNEGETENE